MIKENQRFFNISLVIIDCLSLISSLLVAWWIRFHSGLIPVQEHYLSLKEYIVPVIIFLPLYIIIYSIFNLYKPYRFKNSIEELINIIKSNALGLFILMTLLFLFKYMDYSRYLLFLFALISTSVVIAERMLLRLILRRIRKKGYNLKHILIIGFGETAVNFIEKIKNNAHWGYNIAGILDDHQRENHTNDLEIMGTISELERYLEEKDIDEIFIALPGDEYDKLKFIIDTSEKWGVKSQIIPDFYKWIPARPFIEEIGGLPIIYTRYIPLDSNLNRSIKRLTDLILSVIAIVLFSPIMLLVAIGVKISSPGPVFFKQERVGFNRKNFTMLKFRTMRVQNSLEEQSQWTTKTDTRKTKFGTFLRRASLDELPQFFNVLTGHMSLVGPRPERPFFVERFKEEIPKYMIKHQVKPGITGWAQVNGLRGDTSIKKRIEHDIYYIENWHYLLDIKILFLTIIKMFKSENAY